jgi:hypothetical protein
MERKKIEKQLLHFQTEHPFPEKLMHSFTIHITAIRRGIIFCYSVQLTVTNMSN